MAQTPDKTIRLPQLSDAAVIQMFDELRSLGAKEDDSGAFQLRTAGVALGSFKNLAAVEEKYPDIDWPATRQLSFANVGTVDGIHVSFQRSITVWDAQGHARKQTSAWETEAWLEWSQNTSPSADAMLDVMAVIDARRTAFADAAGEGTRPPDDWMNVQATQLLSLTDLHTKIVRDAEESRLGREKEFERRRSELELQALHRQELADAEIAREREALNERERALEARAKDLDNRGHMHARRELRAQISTDLKERLSRPSVSQSTRMLRRGIMVGGICLGAIFALVGGVALWEFAHASVKGTIGNNVLTYLLSARLAFSAAAVGGIGFYLLGWARRIHDDDLRADRELERYRYDIDRASWAIETILEAQVKDGAREGADVPGEWITGATHGLFARHEPRDDDHAAMEALGSLLNFAAEAELGPGGTRLKLTKNGIRRLKKSGLMEEEA